MTHTTTTSGTPKPRKRLHHTAHYPGVNSTTGHPTSAKEYT